MTNAAHIALSVRSLLWLSDSSCFWWISVLTVLAHFPSSSFSLCFRTFLHPIFLLPLTPLSHHSGLTSQSSHLLCQRLCTHTFFLSSPTSSITLSLPVFLSSFFLHTQSSTCRSSLQQLHFFSSFFFSQHLPGRLAVEYHHHRQLHEQVQPPVFVPAAAQTHGVEPPWCLVSPQENRWEDRAADSEPSLNSRLPLRSKSSESPLLCCSGL